MKALAGWATLQGVTSDWQERQWFAVMKEIEVNDEASDAISPAPRQRVHSDVHITNDTIYPGRSGQIVTADIGEATEASSPIPPPGSSRDTHSLLSEYQLKHTLRRLSRLVLAGYGGPSLLFFGVTPWQTSRSSSVPFSSEKEKSKEEAKLTDAVGVSEAESSDNNIGATGAAAEPGKPSYSWWNVLMGRHDHDIFLQHATVSSRFIHGIRGHNTRTVFNCRSIRGPASPPYRVRWHREHDATFLGAHGPCSARSRAGHPWYDELERDCRRSHM